MLTAMRGEGDGNKRQNENDMMRSMVAGSVAAAARDPGKISALPLPAVWLRISVTSLGFSCFLTKSEIIADPLLWGCLEYDS